MTFGDTGSNYNGNTPRHLGNDMGHGNRQRQLRRLQPKLCIYIYVYMYMPYNSLKKTTCLR
jgi:hypothetical protein